MPHDIEHDTPISHAFRESVDPKRGEKIQIIGEEVSLSLNLHWTAYPSSMFALGLVALFSSIFIVGMLYAIFVHYLG